MHSLFRRGAAALAAVAALGLSAVAHAAPTNFSFAGSFAQANDVQTFTFTANGSSAVRLITYSYAGGTQADGNVVAAGGFDPILALFNASGALVGQNDDAISGTPGTCGGGAVNPDPAGGMRWDTCLDLTLSAGVYTVAVMQFDNFALGPDLANGFTYDGNPNFLNGKCANGVFCDAGGRERNALWAFDILNVEGAQQNNDVPEPASLALAVIALAGLGGARRLRRKD
ncbi:DVUA0089 family protein [Mitsuaria sp. CC2]|uniref:DVUA0089 family protein n=1 Tax=Mitsuaria sp. CC2 TaxID=3029186 RepID=UPI003B8A9CA0